MQLMSWNDRYQQGVIDLWNRTAVRDGYKELTADSFDRIFRRNPYFDPACTFVLLESGVESDSTDESVKSVKSQTGTAPAADSGADSGAESRSGGILGFGCGCTGDDLPLGKAAGYLTCIVLSEEAQTDNHYAILLDAIEERFRSLGMKQADVLFFNPMHLPWYIPDTPGHEHNNAPGAPVGSALHSFLLRREYAERARECAMYLPLAGFRVPEDILAKEAKASEAGYRIEPFDSDRHTGLKELLTALGNPLWESEFSRCAAEGVPFLIAALAGPAAETADPIVGEADSRSADPADPVVRESDSRSADPADPVVRESDSRAAGFAGPVIREPGGRAYFAGIGVDPAHEGRGLGTLLFFKLCEAFRQVGADYMSLYTGSNNPALRIYEKAGFQTVRQFAIMRKELDTHE